MEIEALPQEFLRRMEALLGEETPAYLACLDEPAFAGLRINSRKVRREELASLLPVPLRPAPFSPLSYYVPGEFRPGRLAAHHAGLFYMQEPSAASAVTLLDPQPGERVLDLCAAPGGKSTQIADLLGEEGLLWSNEIVRGRTGALLSNLERMGVKNAVVSCCHPQKLCESLSGAFDRVLVDAPCSGEGMFRRDPEAIRQWSEESPAACAQRQGAILDSAALALREGGVLVYSTCTFSREENEDVIAAFLERHPEFEPAPVDVSFGRPALEGLPGRRIFPMDGGEGHFAAKLRKKEDSPRATWKPVPDGGKEPWRREVSALLSAILREPGIGPLGLAGERVLLLPEELPGESGLGILRAGVEVARFSRGRAEPAHGLFLAGKREDFLYSLDFPPDAPELHAFLRGEELPWEGRGYAAVCVSGHPLGFGKGSGGRLKNHYPKGLRNKG